MKRPRKFYFGDRVAIVDEQYKNHIDHQGDIIETIIHEHSTYQGTTYAMECECGAVLHPKPSHLVLVKARYLTEVMPPIDRNKQHFLRLLGIAKDYNSKDFNKCFSQIIDEVSNKYHKEILIKRFGLDLKHSTPRTYESIGDELEVTRQEIHRAISLAMKKLKESSITKGYQDEGISNTQTEQE
tara:strand:+ start:1069 stop:1620 length:552 start_codon:yes stop_codon:yes gene_type:complete